VLVAKFMVPQLGDKVDSGMGLSYWTARLCSLAGRYDNHMPGQLILPVRDHEFGYWFFWINDTYYFGFEGRKKRNIILDSRLCDFLEKGKVKELSNILFPTPGGKSICNEYGKLGR
jgi:hypothetical protein